MGGNIELGISKKRKQVGDDEGLNNPKRPPRPPPCDEEKENLKDPHKDTKSCQVVVDGKITVPEFMSRGYTKGRSKFALLPYHAKYDKWLDEQLEYLETGINVAVLVDEPVPALHNYMVFLAEYIERNSLRFTKFHHIRLLKLIYYIFTKVGQWHEVVHLAAQILENLISGSRLTRKDVKLEWKPVYDLYKEAKYGKLEEVDGDTIASAVFKLKRFYALEDTAAIWEQLTVDLSPRYSNKSFCDLCNKFLAVDMTAEEHRKYGAGIWWKVMWPMYTTVEMGQFWGADLPALFSSVTHYAPDFMDFSTIYEEVFTRILRGMGLVLRQGKITVGDGTGQISLENFAHWVADWLSGPRSCHPHLVRLMKCLEPFLHPSNSGPHTNNILLFMQSICERIMMRYYQERVKKHKREVPKEYYLSDEDISKFVDVMLLPSLTALYNGDDAKMCTKIIMTLGSLEPGTVIPKFLEHTYPALNAVCEPHRLTQTLDCLIDLVYQIAADNRPDRKKAPIERDWMKELNEVRNMSSMVVSHRRDSVSYRERVMKNQHALTLRHHLIYLLEALTVAIDINDVDKSTISLQNIVLIINLMPLVDSSPCIGIWKDLTEDEKQLCTLTAQLPAMADVIMDKLLNIIQCLSICASKDSLAPLGGLNDETTKTGDEERVLKKAIDRCVSVMLANCSGAVAKSLIDKIFHFISTNQFESALATEMVTGVLAQAVYARPSTWGMFAEFVLKKLKVVLTPEARKQKELGSIALWYVNLASGLFCTTSEAYVKNKAVCFEIIELLVDCDCKVAHETGGTGLWFSLYMLTRIYPIHQHVISEYLNKPLTAWVPIREWAMTYQEHEVSLAWHVPDESRREVIVEMLHKFMFPLIEKLESGSIDKFLQRKYLNLVHMAFCGAITCLPLPPSARGELVNVGPTVLPPAKRGPSGVTNVHWDIPYPGGLNVREKLMSVMEGIIDRLARANKEDSQTLQTIASFIRSLIDDRGIDLGEQNSVTTTATEIYRYLNDAADCGKRMTINAFESFVYSLHLTNVCRENSLPYSQFHHRVTVSIMRLALNDYPEVRLSAQSELSTILSDHPQAREPLVEMVVKALLDENSSEEMLKGALAVIHDNKWAKCGNLKTRMLLWNALITTRMVDRPGFNELMESIWGQIGKITTPERKENPPPSPALTDFCTQWLSELPKTGVWSKFASNEQLETARQLRIAKREEKKKDQASLVQLLLGLHNRRDLHHIRSKICRTMLWRCQRKTANVDTIKMLLSQIADEEEYLRTRCADELSYWLKKNKPKTIRMDWTCPRRPANLDPLLCGLRPDNQCVAYDSKNLPNTEEKWNKMMFFSRQYGCYQWPKSVSVVTFASNPVLDRGQLTDCEQAIVSWFENPKNVEKWISFLLIEKRDENTMNDNTWWMVKFLLRNFPDSELIYKNLTGVLENLLKAKDRASQRLASEFFIGVAKGTKYRPFQKLDELWKWLAPAVDRMYDILNNEAENAWTTAVQKVLAREDPRRFWWLIEQLLTGMLRPAPSAWHQAIRADIIPASKWRDIEIRKRICEIAWRQLPTATIEMQRMGVSTVLKHICTIYDTNLHNDLSGLPERFQLRGTDFWLKRFENKLDSICNLRLAPTVSLSDTNLQGKDSQHTAAIDFASPRSRSNSESSTTEEAREKASLIYLRTLLEFLLQYYEDCMICLTPGIMKQFPMLLDYANEEGVEDEGHYKDVDIKQSASMLVHEYMGSLLLQEKYADDYLNTIINSYDRSCVWRVKVSALKYLQVVVFSNICVCERKQRPKHVTDVIFRGLVDVQNEVREEAARCLLTLAHCDYIKLNPQLVSRLSALQSQQGRRFQHGSVLGYGALVMAHPYSTPPAILPVIAALCRVGPKNAEVQMAATTALREFRRSHRDEWTKTAQILGPQLVYQIENAIAPVYYA